KPANFQSKGNVGIEANPTEVGINEAHWYKNKVAIPASAEGLKFLMWGNATLTNAKMGGECLTISAGNINNPGGGGPPPGGGMAPVGEDKIAAFDAYDCESLQCTTENPESKLVVTPEKLGVAVEAEKAVRHEWEGHLEGTAPTVALGTGATPLA